MERGTRGRARVRVLVVGFVDVWNKRGSYDGSCLRNVIGADHLVALRYQVVRFLSASPQFDVLWRNYTSPPAAVEALQLKKAIRVRAGRLLYSPNQARQ